MCWRNGISLLEVVLALAILAVASAYLAQSMELATTNALKAQRLNKAELVAESVMNQVVAGVIPAQPVTWTQYYSANGQTDWMYQLQQVPTEIDGMLGFQVAVQKVDLNSGLVTTNYDLYANRWIIDPSLGLDTPPEEEETDAGADGGGTSGGGTGSGGTGSGGTGSGGQTGGTGAAGGAGGAGFGGVGAGGAGRGGAPGGGGGPGAGGAGGGGGAGGRGGAGGGAGPGGGAGAGGGGNRGAGGGNAGGRGGR